MGEIADQIISDGIDNLINGYVDDGARWLEEDVGIPKNRHGHILCHYCGNLPKLLHNSTEIYGQNRGKLWICRACRAWVGCHPHRERPLGRLANAELRRIRMSAHACFDPLWKAKAARDRISYGQARDLGYKWLASEMGLTRRQCHIGHFDIAPCEFVIELCEAYKPAWRKRT
jgi:zinc-finger-containing domain